MPALIMPVDNTFENIPMLLTLVLPSVILAGLFFSMLYIKTRGVGSNTIPTMLLFPLVGMLIGNFTYHNTVDLIFKKDYSRFKEGSIFGFIGMFVGSFMGFVLQNKSIDFHAKMVR